MNINIKLLIVGLILLFIIGPILPVIGFLIVENHIKNLELSNMIIFSFLTITNISFIGGLICVFQAVKYEFDWE